MNKKKEFLRINDNKKKLADLRPKGLFFEYLYTGQLPYSPAQFYILSIVCGIVFFFIYSMVSSLPLFSIVLGFIGLLVPYLVSGVSLVLGAKVNEAVSYKEFIYILQSGLRASNSTSEAIKMVAESEDLSSQIKVIMNGISRDLQLGESLPDALENAKKKTRNNYFKMALTIIKINHAVGSDETIDALQNIQKSMDNVIDNVQLFKDKVNGIVTVKSFFLGIALVVPFFLFSSMADVTTLFWQLPYADFVMAFIMAFILGGQLFMDRAAYKLIMEV